MTRMMSLGSGGLSLPLDPESVIRDAGGNALPFDMGTTQFDFRYRDIRFAARVDIDEEATTLRLVGDLGPMPFSAESVPARLGLLCIRDEANQVLGQNRLRVIQGRLLLGGDLRLDPPPTATHLMTAIACFLIPATPYLELIAVYLRPPLAPARPGEPALQPEWRRRRTTT